MAITNNDTNALVLIDAVSLRRHCKSVHFRCSFMSSPPDPSHYWIDHDCFQLFTLEFYSHWILDPFIIVSFITSQFQAIGVSWSLITDECCILLGNYTSRQTDMANIGGILWAFEFTVWIEYFSDVCHCPNGSGCFFKLAITLVMSSARVSN